MSKLPDEVYVHTDAYGQGLYVTSKPLPPGPRFMGQEEKYVRRSQGRSAVHTDDFGNPPAQLSDEDFVAYLLDTLIPDLVASGSTATAEDFQRCVTMIEVRNNALDGILEIAKDLGKDL